MKFKDKFEAYKYYSDMLRNHGLDVSSYREINYGLQFKVKFYERDNTVRIYESKKKGVRIDTSQVKSEGLLSILNGEVTGVNLREMKSKDFQDKSDIEENELIGTDESGKGDYFGPLVIAGVYADKSIKAKLRDLGVDDSKKLDDKKISKISTDIKRLCKHDIVILNNETYNSMYENYKNLNKLLAWGHAEVIENILDQVNCSLVLSDQFGNPKLIKEALREKGQQVRLEQRPRAEENVVVAAASILARAAFIEHMDKISDEYNMVFPKGAYNIKDKAKIFIGRYGREELRQVAKLHFKTTNEI